MPQATLYKNRFTLPGDTGLLDEQRRGGQELAPLVMWGFDERGSFNAVRGLLRKLGVRWYAPGELGEVLPTLRTIALPKMDETVRPDFPIRRFNVRFGVHGHDPAMWAMRLGSRDSIHLALGQNREQNLKDDAAALTAYRAIAATAKQLGRADQFYAVQAIARIQTRRGQFDQALTTLGKVEIDKLRGYWRGSMLLARVVRRYRSACDGETA